MIRILQMEAGKVIRNAALLILISIAQAAAAAAQGVADSARVDTIVVRPRPSCLVLPMRYYHTRIDYSLTPFDADIKPNLSGIETYRISRMESAIREAGKGMTAGMMVGAFGEMVGAWDEKSAFCIAGALAAFGALYGGRFNDEEEGLRLKIDLKSEERGR